MNRRYNALTFEVPLLKTTEGQRVNLPDVLHKNAYVNGLSVKVSAENNSAFSKTSLTPNKRYLAPLTILANSYLTLLKEKKAIITNAPLIDFVNLLPSLSGSNGQLLIPQAVQFFEPQPIDLPQSYVDVVIGTDNFFTVSEAIVDNLALLIEVFYLTDTQHKTHP